MLHSQSGKGPSDVAAPARGSNREGVVKKLISLLWEFLPSTRAARNAEVQRLNAEYCRLQNAIFLSSVSAHRRYQELGREARRALRAEITE